MEAVTQNDAIMRQFKLKEIALRDGSGKVERTRGGAFVVYSRISLRALLEIVQLSNPKIQELEQMKTIFLMGPTPRFFGEERATTSWRREFLSYADTNLSLNENWLVVLPEPFDCNWASVDYPTLARGEEQVYAQIHWENHFIGMSMRSGVAVFHSHFRWKGNAGPTARFEGGRLFSSLARVDCVALNLSPDSESVPYLEAHLSDAICLNALGSLRLTRCSPLFKQQQSTEESMVVEVEGEREVTGQLNEFFGAILSLVEARD